MKYDTELHACSVTKISNYFTEATESDPATIHSFLTVLLAAAEAVEHQVSLDKATYGGRPVVAGTRVPVHLILYRLEAGYSIEDILHSYPRLTREQVRAAIRYAAKVLETGIAAYDVASSETDTDLDWVDTEPVAVSMELDEWLRSFDSSLTKVLTNR